MDDIQSKINQMRDLIATIKEAVDFLKNLEQETGAILSDSPTQKVPGKIACRIQATWITATPYLT